MVYNAAQSACVSRCTHRFQSFSDEFSLFWLEKFQWCSSLEDPNRQIKELHRKLLPVLGEEKVREGQKNLDSKVVLRPFSRSLTVSGVVCSEPPQRLPHHRDFIMRIADFQSVPEVPRHHHTEITINFLPFISPYITVEVYVQIGYTIRLKYIAW